MGIGGAAGLCDGQTPPYPKEEPPPPPPPSLPLAPGSKQSSPFQCCRAVVVLRGTATLRHISIRSPPKVVGAVLSCVCLAAAVHKEEGHPPPAPFRSPRPPFTFVGSMFGGSRGGAVWR